MNNVKKMKLIIALIISVCTFIAGVVATYTWYTNQNLVDTTNTAVESSTTPSLFAGFPDGELNTEKYYGQTGIEYNGDDYPYILNYSPVTVKPVGLDAKLRYLNAGIEGVQVILAGKDEHGQPIVETYITSTQIGREMLSHFTFRMTLLYYNDGVADIEVNKVYKDENGFVVDPSGAPLLLQSGYIYYFDLQVVFQSEEGYKLLHSTQNDIGVEYTFPLSRQKYMFSNIKISFNFGLSELFNVNLNPTGGTVTPTSVPTTGKGLLTLPEPTKELHTFNGWYYDLDCTQPFAENSLTTNPITQSITIYAGWTAMPAITFNANMTGYLPESTVTYIEKGAQVTKPTDPVFSSYRFVGWSENPDATYVDFDTYEYDFSTAVYADKTLYAIWRKEYTVTLNIRQNSLIPYNGELLQYVSGVGTIVATETYHLVLLEGETIASYFNSGASTYLLIRAANSNNSFVHWSTVKSEIGKTYLNTSQYDTTQAQNGNVTLYAYYKPGD